ncbi:MAG: hypothetical protein K0R98_689 [Rickettsiaceae bacterium]|nr:hypothetical protein [Rickettsiaceae bacterium]
MTNNFNTRIDKLFKQFGFSETTPQSEGDKIISAYLQTLSTEELETALKDLESGVEMSVPETFIESLKNA